MFNTLFLGVGNVIAAVQSHIEAAQKRNEIYKFEKVYSDNGVTPEGDPIEAKAPKLMVKTDTGTMVDLYALPEGTLIDIMMEGERQHGVKWNPSNPGDVAAMTMVAKSRYQTVHIL
jgi:hypothetical protein